MFQRIQQYPLISSGNRVYRPRAYAQPRTDGLYDGWLVFFPVSGGPAIASDVETTQSNLDALVIWAAHLSEIYLAGALDRAERIAEQPSVLTTLSRAEYDALEEAEQLEAAATLERIAAGADEQAARAARDHANDLRREREAIEKGLAATDEAAAEFAASSHREAAKQMGAVAADARKRRKAATRKRRKKDD
jgi:hypothetical protein